MGEERIRAHGEAQLGCYGKELEDHGSMLASNEQYGMSRYFLVGLGAALALCLSGCNGAPSLTIAGAYFPAWLLCAIIAVVVAIVVRSIMVATGLSNRIPFQLAVCLSIGVIVALIFWRLWVVR